MGYLAAGTMLLWMACSGVADLRVRVLDPHGAGVPGALAEIRGAGADARPVVMAADKHGSLSVQVNFPARVRVTARGFEPAEVTVREPEADFCEVRLSPAILHTSIEVFVRDETPLAGISEGAALEIDRRGARTVYDAVDRLVPGAHVTRRGVMGYGLASASGAVSIRGVGASPNTQVLVVVDGRPDYMGLMGHPIPDFYSLSDVESIAVTQGPASVLYGNRAMGGIIDIRPRTPRGGMYTEFSTGFGSFYTGQHRLSHGAAFGRGYYSLNAGVAHTSGERENSAFHGQDGTFSAGYQLSPVWKAGFNGRFGHFNVEDPGTVQAPAAGQYANVGRGGFSVSLDNASTRTWGSARMFSNHGHHMLWDGFRSVDNTTGMRLHQSLLIAPGFILDGGMDWVRYGGSARNIKTKADYGEHHITESAGFSRVQVSPSRNLLLNAGVRYDHSSLHGGVVVSEFGATKRLTERYSLSVASAKGFRNPTIRELFLFPAPNPLLRPERMWNHQLTFQARPATSFMAWVTAYYADINSLIVTTGRFPNIRLQNGGRALNRGFELNARWQPAQRLVLSSGYAHLRSTNLAPYAPRHKLNYSADLDAGRVFMSLSGMTVGRTWANVQRSQQVGQYTVLTLKCTAPIGERANLFVALDNLLNRRYEVILGYPMPGANLMAGLNFKF